MNELLNNLETTTGKKENPQIITVNEACNALRITLGCIKNLLNLDEADILLITSSFKYWIKPTSLTTKEEKR